MSERNVISEKNQLRSLARQYGIQATYHDVFGRINEPPAEALLSVLRMLGAHAETMSDVAGALRERRNSLAQRAIEPVLVAWDGAPLHLKLRLPLQLAETPVRYCVVLEEGEARAGQCRENPCAKSLPRDVEGSRYAVRKLTLPETIPHGYQRLYLQIGAFELESQLFSAPSRSFAPAQRDAHRWGLFCPLYALDSENSWGAGSFSDLAALTEFAAQLGADMVGTLPLLATFLSEPYNPSPYSPVSRLFWNEFYLDVTRLPEFQSSPAAKALINTASFADELERLRAAPLVEYRQIMTTKRLILEELLCCLLNKPSDQRGEFERFVSTHPGAQDYAEFRAKTEREGKPWQRWPSASRDGKLRAEDYDASVKRYHLYVQWRAQEQMRALGEKSDAGGPSLYLDFPLGVNRDGYDVWRERDVFALDASGGAPPDGFFTKGQSWGFPPLHPEGLRRQGYRHYIQCVRNHLRFAKMLRIDHVMGLHRLFWVPDGFAPTEGVYVRYPAEEFFAVLSLESHRHGAQIVGENLGTVPAAINAAMAQHNILGINVGQFGVTRNPEQALDAVPSHVVASLNTHDTPTFAGFWSGADIDDRRELGLLADEEVSNERTGREQQRVALVAYLEACGLLDGDASDAAAVLRAWLMHLATGDSEILLINLEDLWLEPLPQNVPGTSEERPNWMRKAGYSLEQIRRLPMLRETLLTIDQLRKRGSESKS